MRRLLKWLGLAYSSGLAVVAGIVDLAQLDEIIDHRRRALQYRLGV